jgi:predicted dehydrogenase
MEKIKVGLIGGGAFGEAHLIAYSSMPQVEIGGIFTRNKERRKYLCERYGGKNCHSIDELLDMKEIRAVSIVTAEQAHLEPFEAVIKSGKAVYVEKPIATNLKDANRMIELSRNSIVMTGHILRFEVRYVRVYEEMSKYGPIRHIYMRRRRPVFQKEHYSRVHPAYSIFAHDYDIANWYMKVPFERVIAMHGFYRNEPVPDYMNAMIEYENGATAIIEGGWLLPQGCGFIHNDVCSVAMEKGAFEMSIPDSGLKIYGENQYLQPNLNYEISIYGKEYGPLRASLEYFIDAVINDKKVDIATIEQGRDVVLLVEAAIKSANESRYVSREEMI